MTELSTRFGFAGSARVFVGELPALPPAPQDGTLAVDLDADPGGRPGSPVCVEIVVRRGARALYGLLGAGHVPDESGRLQALVPLASGSGGVFESPLTRVEPAYSGLPPEYGQFVVDALAAAPPVPAAAGLVRFDHAAHTVAGSAPLVFAKIAPLVLELMFSDPALIGPELVSDRLTAAFEQG